MTATGSWSSWPVIPQPLDRLIKSNPGLSSRFSRQFTFPDYSAAEMGRIIESSVYENRYILPPSTRVKLLLGFQHLLDHRDENFGNGRLVRNVFEQAIGRLANRITGVAPLTREILTTLEPDDIVMPDVPAERLARAGVRRPLFSYGLSELSSRQSTATAVPGT